jgi:hypothetical protein
MSQRKKTLTTFAGVDDDVDYDIFDIAIRAIENTN